MILRPAHHGIDPPEAEPITAHPLLLRAASFGAAALLLSGGLLALVLAKTTLERVVPPIDMPVIDVLNPPIDEPDRPAREPVTQNTADDTTEVAIAGAGETEIPTPPTEQGGATGPATPVITDPRWLSVPDGRAFERFYPDRAYTAGVAAQVMLDCTVGADGRLTCSVASETPANWGFGRAALGIARSFRMAPQTIDGRPTDGGRVSVPISFRVE